MKVIIIGGDAAGMSAAMQIVRNKPDAQITVYEKGDIYSYGQCGLPYVIGGQIESTDRLIARKRETFQEKYGIETTIHHLVQHVDPANKTVSGINTETNKPFETTYDKLLIATGASPVMPPWDNNHLKGITMLKTIPDAHNIMNTLQDRNVQHVTIVGGGYIGLEMAESFKQLGLNVTIIQRGSQLAGVFDRDMAKLILEEAKSQGVEVKLSESVKGFSGEEYVSEIITNKGSYRTDFVLVSVGVTPNISFLDGTSIHKGLKNAIKVDATMKTNDDHIYAAGDCALQYHRIKERDDYIPLGTHANKQGQVAGLNIAGERSTFKGVVGTAIMKFFDLSLGRTGLTETEAEEMGLTYQSIVIDSKDIAGYYPGDTAMKVKLVYEKPTGKLLGGQIIGHNGVDKRIDVLSTALFNEMGIKDLLHLDLAYAPPYNGVWDPIQQAARKVTL